ncbi:hypothetical protein ACN267_21495 [Micromonospora sp. WMMD734]|uniref:hypothetical protein n=1 Tax=Micromonospora sp. WMMD734 TaxID=3404129 RepID=UPI003B928D02
MRTAGRQRLDVHLTSHRYDAPPAYSGYAMTPDGEGEYEFTRLTGSAENKR